jgi:hypothetical protein
MFERLTRWENNDKDVADLIEEKSDFDGLTEAINRLAAYEDSGLSPEEVQEFAKAKADGRLVVLPCKVGDTVYWRSRFGSVASGKVSGVRLTKHFGIDLQIESEEKPNSSVWREMEKVFLTREAAEKAIAEVRE